MELAAKSSLPKKPPSQSMQTPLLAEVLLYVAKNLAAAGKLARMAVNHCEKQSVEEQAV
jgi:hypothetical protein